MTLPWVRAKVGWGEVFIAELERKELAEVLRERVIAIKAANLHLAY